MKAADILEPEQWGSPEMDEELVRPEPRALSLGNWESQLDAGLAGVLDQIDELNPGWAESGREEVARALVDYSWTQRLYFVVRSGLMGVLGAIVTAGVVASLGTVNALQVVVIGVLSFVVSLAITRVIDDQMSHLSKIIVDYLSKHRRVRDLIVNHF